MSSLLELADLLLFNGLNIFGRYKFRVGRCMIFNDAIKIVFEGAKLGVDNLLEVLSRWVFKFVVSGNSSNLFFNVFAESLHKVFAVIDDPFLDPDEFLSKSLHILKVLFNVRKVVNILKLIKFHLVLLSETAPNDIKVENVVFQLIELFFKGVDVGNYGFAILLNLLFSCLVKGLELFAQGCGDLLVRAVLLFA